MRLEWLDILKGIGIVSVVLGHVLGWRYVYSFHIPLFFFISGYVFHDRGNELAWIKRCSIRYLLPYCSFLLSTSVFSLCVYGKRLSTYKLFYGGGELQGIYGTFWFITVLFLALILLNFVVRRGANFFILIVICLAFSYLFQYLNVSIIWNAQVVPMALVYMLLGYSYKISDLELSLLKFKQKPLFYCLLAFVCIVPLFTQQLNLDMKITDFGIPVFSLVSSVIISYGMLLLSKWLAIHKTMINNILIYFGQASLVIMFLHQLVKQTFIDTLAINCDSVYFILSILVPTMFFFLFSKFRFTKLFFLGKIA